MSAEAYGMLAIPIPVSTVPVSINPLRLNLRIRGRIRPPWTTTPTNPMNANTQPFSLSLQPRPPLSGSIEVNRMKVPCIMVKPTRNRKLTLTSADMFGRRITEAMLVKVAPSWEIGDFDNSDLDSFGRLSGSMNAASIRAIADIALEKRQGSK
tara:strand:- start:132 stop:590 length:459 start_codon:yes stop_codon:yes gene_type:complete